MLKLSVIILSYNTKELTKKCLEFLLENLINDKSVSSEIIIVDNASTDGSVELLKNIENKNSIVKLILNKTNVGYPKGNNQALDYAKGEYVLFLNSDVMIESLNFRRLLSYLDSHLEVGIVTVKVKLPSGRIDEASHRGFPTLWNSFCYFTKLEKIFGRVPVIGKFFGGYHLTSFDLRTIHEIDSPSGAFYLTRKLILDKVHGFDEQFFMYGEDLDLSYRIKQLGYKVLYYPFFHVLHVKYASGLQTKDRVISSSIKEHFYNAMKIFYSKHYAPKTPSIINSLVYFFIDLKKKIT